MIGNDAWSLRRRRREDYINLSKSRARLKSATEVFVGEAADLFAQKTFISPSTSTPDRQGLLPPDPTPTPLKMPLLISPHRSVTSHGVCVRQCVCVCVYPRRTTHVHTVVEPFVRPHPSALRLPPRWQHTCATSRHRGKKTTPLSAAPVHRDIRVERQTFPHFTDLHMVALSHPLGGGPVITPGCRTRLLVLWVHSFPSHAPRGARSLSSRSPIWLAR